MRKRKDVNFRPTNEFLRQAILDYLANGGIITRIELNEEAYRIFVAGAGDPIAVDEFLTCNSDIIQI